MLKKQTLLYLSGAVTGILLAANWIGTFKLCGGLEYGNCMDATYGVLMILLPAIPVLFFSLLTYRMSGLVYETWFKFARWWIPFSMIAIFLSPEYSDSFLYSIDKGTVAVATCAVFIAVSLILIAYRYFRSK